VICFLFGIGHVGEISHQMAIDKSSEEFEKYKDVQNQVEKENSIKELEDDLRELTKKIKKGNE